MKFSAAIEKICRSSNVPLTPQQIRERIKAEYPEFYSTPSHLRNVAKGHYKDTDHALLAQIYIVVRSGKVFLCDVSCKPMQISIRDTNNVSNHPLALSIRRDIPHQKPKKSHAQKIREILANATEYHDAYYQSVVFTGPSLYFHQRAIDTCKSVGSLNHLEYVYAALTSWGMHRMGAKGSKMIGFQEFGDSIRSLSKELVYAQGFTVQNMDEEKWAVLQKIFQEMRVMSTSVSLVGHSKAMHHILPNIIPPIDRSYTLRYLYGNTTIHSDLKSEWAIMREIVESFFIPIVADQNFELLANRWLTCRMEYPWDTSMMKIVDNLVIGALKVS